jgi:V8-like Glu-specific endopeptidase
MRALAILAALLLAGCVTAPHKTTHRLDFDDGVCSGTAVGKHVILSAEHCFTGSHTLAIDGKPVEVLQIVTDGNDHALATVSATFDDIATRGYAGQIGQHVHYWGNPAGLGGMYREGYISGTWVVAGKATNLIDVNGFYGDSGAGVFDADGHLIGVISVLYQNAESGYIKFMGIYPFKFTREQWEGAQ